MKITPATLYPSCEQSWALTAPALPPDHHRRWRTNRLPWSAGGASQPENLRPAHARCNLAKGGRSPVRKGVRPAARRK
jgi:hypothetical protein